MKRIRFASCLMVLFLLVLNLEIALGQEQSGIDAISQDSADHSIGAENADGGYVVNLEVDGGFLALTFLERATGCSIRPEGSFISPSTTAR